MKIVIAGGTGLNGTKPTSKLHQKGHKVVPASRRTDVNSITGERLDPALSGADIVIDVADSPSLEDGATHLYDRKCDPRVVIDKPFHSIHFYISATALNGLAKQYGARR